MLPNYKKVNKQLLILILSSIILISLSVNFNRINHEDNNLKYNNQPTDKLNIFNNALINFKLPSYLLSNYPLISKIGSFSLHFSTIMIAATIKGQPVDDKSKSKRPSVINNGKLIEKQKPTNLDIESKIKGKTLDIYYYMIEVSSEVGVREITREFGYSSPALAAYHLNRLVDFEIVVKNENNRYILADSSYKIGKLSDSVKLGKIWITQMTIFKSILFLFSLIAISFFVLNVNQKIWALTFIPLSLFSLGIVYKMQNNHR